MLNGVKNTVVHLRNGAYGLIEIKLGGEKWIEEGAKTSAALKIESVCLSHTFNPIFSRTTPPSVPGWGVSPWRCTGNGS